MKGVLLLEVDGPDTEPLGVFGNAQQALNFLIEMKEAGTDEEDVQAMVSNFEEIFAGPYPEEFDRQMESGTASYDYRFVTVQVQL